MAITPKTLAVAGGATGSIGAVGAGIYVATKGETITIKDLVGSHAITNESDFQKRLETKGTDTHPEGINDKAGLQNWCKKHYETVVTKKIEKDTALINSIKKWCLPTIKQKLEGITLSTEDTSGNNDAEDWKIRARNLKDYETSEEEIKDIKTTKDSITNPETDTEWQKLRTWCINTYKDNFQGDNNNLWKLAKKFCTKATIKDALHGAVLPETEDEWTAKSTKASNDTEGEKTKDEKLHKALKKEGANKNQELKNWCSKKHLENHDEKVKDNANDKLLEEVKKWCVLTIKEKLGNEKIFDGSTSASSPDTNLQKKMEILDDADKEKDTKLKAELSNWKSNATDATKQKEFKDWCQTLYPKHYKGAEDNDWKLAKKYCEKTN